MKSYIHLIRHGTTEGNVKRWYYGHADIPLLEEGMALVASLKEEGIYPEVIDADFYTSGLLRTEQTFQIIFGERDHQVLEEFMEMSFGDYEKRSYEDLKELEEYQQWICDKTGTAAPPKGESAEQFRKRVSQGFKKLQELHQRKELSVNGSEEGVHSVVVCHGGVISALMAEHFSAEGKDFFTWIPDPGHGYTIELENGIPIKYNSF